ncbi:hypothetical protein HJC23_013935 [Cyclotella cryptica]|uniref:Uncharacterized protein n=1 Tax=Cyclotella cryptica TaxID=29204 RepID=A0ABD3NLT0_9STRA
MDESNDEKRRKALSGILDKELVSPQSSIRVNSPSEENSKPVATHTELPRFAKLFQVSLDNVGERVQNEVREKALERQESSDGSTGEGKAEGEGEDLVGQLKSEEELQLWALIDMMVQSKTRVKLYMGTLGSKGAFR